MAERNQLLGEPVNDALGAAVQLRWHRLREWRDLSNPHLNFSCPMQCPQPPSTPQSHAGVDVTRDVQQIYFLCALDPLPRLTTNLYFAFSAEPSATAGKFVLFMTARPGNSRAAHLFGEHPVLNSGSSSTDSPMDELTRLAHRPLAFIFRYVRPRPRISSSWPRSRGGCLLGQHAIRREIPGRQPCPPDRHSRRRVWLAFAFLVSPDRGGQPPLAGGELDRELHLRRRHRRSAARPLPPSDRPFAAAISPIGCRAC